MKFLLVCDEKSINNHVGEEYDEILEVIQIPTTDNIKSWADRVRSALVGLWNLDKSDDKKVVVTLDSSAPYRAVLINLRIKMGEENGIKIELFDSNGNVFE